MALTVTRTRAETILIAGPEIEPVRTMLSWFGTGRDAVCTRQLLFALPDHVEDMVGRLRAVCLRFRRYLLVRSSNETLRALDALAAYCDAADAVRAAEALLADSLGAHNPAVYCPERQDYAQLTSSERLVVRAWARWLADMEEQVNQIIVVVEAVRREDLALASEAGEPRKRVRPDKDEPPQPPSQ
jgi:hypothetical protein